MNRLVTLQMLVERLRDSGDRPALISIGTADAIEMRSFSTVSDDAENLAAGLLAAGVEKGEPVGIYGDGGPDWVVAFLAIVAAGAVAVPFDIGLKKAALAEPVHDSGCRRFFVTGRHAADLQDCGAADDADLYLLDGKTTGADPGLRPWRSLTTARRSPLPGVAASDRAALFYTSGTTGTPKGVPLTHANIIANINSLLVEQMVAPGDRVLLPLPPHHVYPLVVGVLAPLASAVGVIFPAGVSGPQIVDALRRGDASVLIGVPRLYSALLDAIDARIQQKGRVAKVAIKALYALLDAVPDPVGRAASRVIFRSVRSAFGPRLWLLASGGARLDEKTWRALERFGWTVLTGYGLTETAPILTFNPLGRSRIGSAGRALSNIELRLGAKDKDNIGEIEARGPNVFAGYRDRAEETATAFTPDGWFRTGDLGWLDEDGYLYVVGRARELIVLPDGKKFFPEAVEAVYNSSPLIREIAIFDQDGALVGLVVPDLDELRKRGAESATLLIHDAIRDLSPALAPHQRLSNHVVTQLALPRTAIGKLRRHKLPDLYRTAISGMTQPESEITAEDRAFLSDPRAIEIWNWLTLRFPDRTLSLDISPQLDLGIDSLGWTGLSLEIEDRFGVSLSEDQIAQIVTLRDLIHHVKETVSTSPLPGELLPEQRRYLSPFGRVQTLLGTALYGIFRLAMRLFFRLRVLGIANVPKTGPFIIAPNHASWLDPIAIAASLSYAQVRQIRFAGWAGLMFDSVAARTFSWVARVFPVNPDRAAASSLMLARAALDQGDILVWFPEGRRSTTGDLLPFQPGIGALIDGTAVPVVPAYISGTFEAAPTGRHLPKLARIEVRFGKPQTAEVLTKSGNGETTAQRLASALQDAVSTLQEESSLKSPSPD